MEVSRRSLIATAMAGVTVGALSIKRLATAETTSEMASEPASSQTPSPAASPPKPARRSGDVVGKITVGYQGWFACAGDAAPINGWWHRSQDWSRPPSPAKPVDVEDLRPTVDRDRLGLPVFTAIKSWPDTREYHRAYPTGYPKLGNGQPATLFSSYDEQTGPGKRREKWSAKVETECRGPHCPRPALLLCTPLKSLPTAYAGIRRRSAENVAERLSQGCRQVAGADMRWQRTRLARSTRDGVHRLSAGRAAADSSFRGEFRNAVRSFVTRPSTGASHFSTPRTLRGPRSPVTKRVAGFRDVPPVRGPAAWEASW
jgi:hypothetical protein